jgi:hypothetical protein
MRVVRYAYFSHGRTVARGSRWVGGDVRLGGVAKGAHVCVRPPAGALVRASSFVRRRRRRTVAIDESASSAHEFAVATTSCDAFVIFR